MNQELVIHGVQYTYEENPHGEKIIKRYNKRYKVWVTLRFNPNSTPNSILETLEAQFLERMTTVF